MATAKRTPPIAHVTPALPEPAKATVRADTCVSCKGALRAADGHLRCHGAPPQARYANMVMGVGPSGEAIWPTVKDNDWCLAHTAKEENP
jgi:hypothetical protein